MRPSLVIVYEPYGPARHGTTAEEPPRWVVEHNFVLEDHLTVEVETAFSPEDLRVRPLELAVSVARDVYAGFGWLDPMQFVLDGIQEEALR